MSRHRLVSRTPDMIGEFLAAAAYVRQSDIAQRLDLATLGTRWRLTIATHGGVSSAGWIDRPPTAEIEQGATRLRPLMLKQETVYAPKVLNKLGRRVNDPVWRNTDLKPVQDAWKNFDTTMYWSAAVSAVDNDEPAPMRSDRQIAKDYRYGHLLHRDPERRQSGPPPADLPAPRVRWTRARMLPARAPPLLVVAGGPGPPGAGPGTRAGRVRRRWMRCWRSGTGWSRYA